jgi:hypothetical protein
LLDTRHAGSGAGFVTGDFLQAFSPRQRPEELAAESIQMKNAMPKSIALFKTEHPTTLFCRSRKRTTHNESLSSISLRLIV